MDPCSRDIDPGSLEWCDLDADFKKKLDQTPFYSPSRERKMAELPTEENAAAGSKREPKPVDRDEYEVDPDPSEDGDIEIPEGSLFDYHMPGVLTPGEVSKLDLDHWKLLVRNTLVDFEVRSTPFSLSLSLSLSRQLKPNR